MAEDLTPVDDRVVGKGITFPFELDNGAIKIDSGFTIIKRSIETILAWPYGFRFFLNEFGSRIDELLEDPNDDFQLSLVRFFIVEAISTWEKRIELLGQPIFTRDDSKLNLVINYRILSTGQEGSMVYPFYNDITT